MAILEGERVNELLAGGGLLPCFPFCISNHSDNTNEERRGFDCVKSKTKKRWQMVKGKSFVHSKQMWLKCRSNDMQSGMTGWISSSMATQEVEVKAALP